MDLTLTTHTRIVGEITDTVLIDNAAEIAPDAYVFTPTDPIPARRLVNDDPDPRKNRPEWSRWDQDGPTFAKVKRVRNWGWLLRATRGYGEPNLCHPLIGPAFYVRTWRYQPGELGRSAPMPIPHQRFSELVNRDCIIIARLSDGRYFADAWADRSVFYDALDRSRNFQGYTIDWQEPSGGPWAPPNDPPTCAIGGADWRTIPDLIAASRERTIRMRERVVA